MYAKLHAIFADKMGGEAFDCFGPWHFFYIILTIAVIALSIILTKNKGQDVKERLLKIYIGIAFGLYMLDFFLMPFAFGEIYIDKLPFHACTLMCIMCFISRNYGPLRSFRADFALLGLLSNLTYLCYPAGVMWYQIGPLSYRVIQTLLFHATMTVYCMLTIVLDDGLKLRNWKRDLIILCSLTVWALIGNALYTGSLAEVGYYETPNWFFVADDPLNILPNEIAPYIAPWLNIIVFFTVEILIRLIYSAIQKKISSKNTATA